MHATIESWSSGAYVHQVVLAPGVTLHPPAPLWVFGQVDSSVRMSVAIDQPSTRREQTSKTQARYSHVPPTCTYVMSPRHFSFRRSAAKSRRTRSGAGGASRPGDRGALAPAQVPALDPLAAHQPLDPLAVDRVPKAPQLGVHTPHSVDAAVVVVSLADLRDQRVVVSPALGTGDCGTHRLGRQHFRVLRAATGMAALAR
ncbi:hypothetical protein ACE1SV_00220 [Streptomyces sennicomposti]